MWSGALYCLVCVVVVVLCWRANHVSGALWYLVCVVAVVLYCLADCVDWRVVISGEFLIAVVLC